MEYIYDTTRNEYFPVVAAVLVLKLYMKGAQLNVQTDYDALRWILNLEGASNDFLCWRLCLSDFELDLVH